MQNGACMRRFLAMLVLVGCGSATEQVQPTVPPIQEQPEQTSLSRLRFNQLAMRLDLPLYWVNDTNGDQRINPDEIVTLHFYASQPTWVRDGAFTDAYREAYAAIIHESERTDTSPERLRWVETELDTAAPTLLHANLEELPRAHRQFVREMMSVGTLIDAIYARQVGMTRLAANVASDTPSRSLFRRNWGPRCRAPSTETEAACSAIEGGGEQPVDVYPLEIQGERHFCVTLESREDADELLSPFTVVNAEGDAMRAVPYTEHFEKMAQVADGLERAAQTISGDSEEAALVTYLRAAAQSFRDNNWGPADEAWSRMNARNSRWYVRVAPDEVYWDPCSHKAGFHMTLALIDQGSLVWQDRLNPLQADMEGALAALSEAYEAREVAFHMPDFISIVANFGDDRDPFGATIGQSLPNWGAVAEEGRGRTVAMTNLYTDADSLARRRATAASLLSAETMQVYTDETEAGLMSTILHEATHNLGPASEYRVEGKADEEIFGGGMASMLEELKAQSGALYFLPMLRERGVLTEARVRETYLDSIVWAFGHISRGMYTPSGWRKAYSQLAAVQIGFLMDAGAIRFSRDAESASGDRGAFEVNFDALPEAVEQMMTRVMQIKAAGDKDDAEALAARYVDGDTVPMALITERFRRQPRASFVFAVEY